MPHIHDDAADQIMHQLRARMLTATVHVDGEALPATPRRYFETNEGDVLDVQAVLAPTADGGLVIHVGDSALSPTGVRGLVAYLAEVLDVLDQA